MSLSYEFAQKDVAWRRWGHGPVSDSPVDHVRKQFPRGEGEWPGFDSAAHKMASEKYMLCSDEHITLMAILGCGHEEPMKAEMHRLLGRGYIILSNTN
jgi:hypothetical protein